MPEVNGVVKDWSTEASKEMSLFYNTDYKEPGKIGKEEYEKNEKLVNRFEEDGVCENTHKPIS